MKRTMLYNVGKVIVPPIFHVLYPFEVHGTENMPKEGRVIVCSNHITMRDPVWISLGHKRQIFYMAKSELFENKFVSSVITALGAFPVNRGRGDGQALDAARVLLEKEQAVGIFLEGTRSRTGKLLRPKTGAVMLAKEMNCPILPMCITAKNETVPGPFQKAILSCGKLIMPQDLPISEGTGTEYRNASRMVMQEIMNLRENDLQKFH